MRRDTLDALERTFQESPVMCAGGVNRTEVDALQNQIGFRLPADYREFLEKFGGAIVGPFVVYGLRASEAMSEEESSAIRVTERFRADRWPGTDKWLVVSMDHSGNPVGLDRDGKIWISDHDSGALQMLASSFENYIRKWCLKLESLA